MDIRYTSVKCIFSKNATFISFIPFFRICEQSPQSQTISLVNSNIKYFKSLKYLFETKYKYLYISPPLLSEASDSVKIKPISVSWAFDFDISIK